MPCTNLGNMAEATLRVAHPVRRALLVRIGNVAALLVKRVLPAKLAVLVTRVHLVNNLPDAKVVKAAREVKARRAKLVLSHSLWPIAR